MIHRWLAELYRITTRSSRIIVLAAAVLCLMSLSAMAAVRGAHKPSEVILILQIVALIVVGRGLGELMQRIGQPSVIGELLAGLLLGPSVFGWLWPEAQAMLFPPAPEQKALIDGIAQFGILLLLLLTGMETDLKLVRRVGRAAATISLAGILVPFVCGFALGQFLPESLLPHAEQRLVASLFLGTALSISSVKIVAVVVREMKFMRRNVGQIIIASAVIDDTLGWIIIAIIFSLAAKGHVDMASLAQSVIGTLAFLVISLTIGRRIVFRLIRGANDHLVSTAPVITVILLLMGGMALITDIIGVHTVLGAFVAGILVGESPILTRQIDEQLRGLISSLFMPVFFGLAGLNADLTVLKDPHLLFLTGMLVLIASIGKFSGAFIGGELGGLTRMESLALASGMNARGSTEVIVASIGLSIGVLSQNLFTMILTMAIITTMAMPPMLRAALSRLPLGSDEKARLEREEHEEKGFVANLERLLVAVDESPNGRFASRIAGLLAGARGIPTTVLHIGRQAKYQEKKSRDNESPETTVKAAAKETAAVEKEAEGERSNDVDVTTRVKEAKVQDAIAEEARKGFGLLIVGLGNIANDEGAFRNNITRATAEFDQPLAVVAARGRHLEQPVTSRFRILLPISGSEHSRRGAEVAIALARATAAPLRAIYISANGSTMARRRGGTVTHLQEEAVLKDVVALAERYNVLIDTTVRTGIAPEDAILQESRRARANLIVMGVDRVPGERLSFGDTAAAVLKKSKMSLLFVSD